ncbi:MAG: GNAT family N-acetyltransferase [Vampirovibrionales bacterium]
MRPITPADNDSVKAIILRVLGEYGCVGPGYASNDSETQVMSTAYDGQTGQYWVVEDPKTGDVLGGGGFARLKGTQVHDGIAELQKLYFLPQLRGQGVGQALLHHCVHMARRCGYTTLYAETVPHMHTAIALYQKAGFLPVENPLGCTGHAERCTARYVLALT